MWFIRVEVEQETSAPPPKKNPGSARAIESFRSEPDENEYKIELKVFYACSQKKTSRKALFYFLSPKKLVRLFTLKDVKPSPESKIIKLLTFDNLFLLLRHSRAKPRSGMTTAITFSRQNDAGSRLSNTQY